MFYDYCCVYIFNNVRLSLSKLCLFFFFVLVISFLDLWNFDNMNKSLLFE